MSTFEVKTDRRLKSLTCRTFLNSKNPAGTSKKIVRLSTHAHKSSTQKRLADATQAFLNSLIGGGNSNIFSPRILAKISILTSIFVRWIGATPNRISYFDFELLNPQVQQLDLFERQISIGRCLVGCQ